MPGSIRRQTERNFLARLRTLQGPWGIKSVQDQGHMAWQLLWLLRSRLVSDSQNLIQLEGCRAGSDHGRGVVESLRSLTEVARYNHVETTYPLLQS